MTENLGNVKVEKEEIKNIIRKLHKGEEPESLKKQFSSILKRIDSTKLGIIEQELMEEGMSEKEVKKLCDVHVLLFKETLDDEVPAEVKLGHPVQIFISENRAIKDLVENINKIINSFLQNPTQEQMFLLKGKMNLLFDIEKHYHRKEYLLFPILEKYNFVGPSKVMWELDDDIIAGLKKVKMNLEKEGININKDFLNSTLLPILNQITEMVYKEEKILFPNSLEKLSKKDWYKISIESDDIGYSIVEPKKVWKPNLEDFEEIEQQMQLGKIRLETGVITLEQLEKIFAFLPVDITYVDENDNVKFFSNSPDRIFIRSKAIIGRKVQNCHPPRSVHVVEGILKDFKQNKRDIAEFWLSVKEKFIHIRYFAIREDSGKYIGTLEVSQDITDIRKLEGEKRILL